MGKCFVDCNVEDCRHNQDGECTAGYIVICEETCMTVEKLEDTAR